jgi:CBS domain-containing protein
MITYRPLDCKGSSQMPRPALSVGTIALRIPPLLPDDSIARAAEAIRQSPAAAVPVAEDGRIVGVVTAEHLKVALAGVSAEHIRCLPVSTVMSADLLCLREGVTVEHALETFREHDVDAAPVLDEMGRYVGIVATAVLLTASCGRLRPSNIGGLATPLGVYLTNGSVRAGVGDLGLASAGLYIGLLQLIASWCAFKLTPGMAHGLQGVVASLGRQFPGVGFSLLTQDPSWPYAVLLPVFFGVLFRFSWVTGLHAAEHQVVHAIERGDVLTPEAVRRMPRVHPRCGTNLLAAFGIYMLIRSFGEGWDVIGFMVVPFTWRLWGGFLQQHVTTRKPTDRQLANGIAAGQELLDRYQLAVKGEPSRWRRIWNIGLIQVALGFSVMLVGLWLLKHWVPFEDAWLQSVT